MSKPNLLPVLRSQAWLDNMLALIPSSAPADMRPWSRPVAEGIHVILAEEYDESLTYMTLRWLSELKLNPEQAYELALSSFERLAKKNALQQIKIPGAGEAPMLMRFQESFTAQSSCVLLPSLLKFAQDVLGDPIGFAVPQWDDLTFFRLEPAIIAQMRDSAAASCKSARRPITDRLYRADGSGIQLLDG